jgi:hypothetical protein
VKMSRAPRGIDINVRIARTLFITISTPPNFDDVFSMAYSVDCEFLIGPRAAKERTSST